LIDIFLYNVIIFLSTAYNIYKIMTLKSRYISLITVFLALIVYNITLLYTFAKFDINFYVKVVSTVLNIPILIFSLIGVIGNYQQCVRWVLSISVLLAIVSICYYIVLKFDLISKFDSAEKVQAFLSKYGAYAGIIFIAVQFLQVTIIPLPAAITTLAGVALFGFWPTFFYSVIGTMIGSMLAFYLGRKFGVKLIIWLFGKNSYDKYVKFTQGKDKIVLTLMFFFPFFPDDLLCIVAGITDMKYWQFFIIMLITRPLNILILEGALKGFAAIPLTGYGIPIWIAIIAIALIAVVLAFKYSNKLEKALISLFDKISSKIKKKDKIELKEIYSQSKSCYDKKNIIK